MHAPGVIGGWESRAHYRSMVLAVNRCDRMAQMRRSGLLGQAPRRGRVSQARRPHQRLREVNRPCPAR